MSYPVFRKQVDILGLKHILVTDHTQYRLREEFKTLEKSSFTTLFIVKLHGCIVHTNFFATCDHNIIFNTPIYSPLLQINEYETHKLHSVIFSPHPHTWTFDLSVAFFSF